MKMNIKVTPSSLAGSVRVPSSKSIAHRMITAAALADGTTVIENVSLSRDIEATCKVVSAFGAEVSISGSTVTVKGISSPAKSCTADCGESGSTLRFCIPVASALGITATFNGSGRLPSRPITPYIRELSAHGITFDCLNSMPFTVSGRLSGGSYNIEGDISSQFITGLLLALPLLSEDSTIALTSPLQSKPYVDITIDVLSRFGIEIRETEDGYSIKGGQKYVSPHTLSVEGDYSQAAFFYVANALGAKINIANLTDENYINSPQGDRKILEIIGNAVYNDNGISKISGFDCDVSQIPDLVPALAVLASFADSECTLYNASRLAIKESNRLTATADMLNALGGCVTPQSDKLIIKPVKRLNGGTIDSVNDHRIAMAAAIASCGCEHDVIIRGADAVSKSYPSFFDDFTMLGGKTDVINLE